ncbi:Uncharacterized protein APZ42_000381 [Daphnia magna]|uniref:Uncharacterized protein n=1 Tax=Daphnia magna TaxID=35525 RepID=A0A164JQ01_9CRUS|nr:Uncharacterized protein APZ42_000381 [Daphnia magna]
MRKNPNRLTDALSTAEISTKTSFSFRHTLSVEHNYQNEQEDAQNSLRHRPGKPPPLTTGA